jgi:hypothetical protein
MNTNFDLHARPKLRAYTVHASSQYPSEWIIQLEENGAALGISSMEKKLLPFLDGRNRIQDLLDILQFHGTIPITALKKFLHDLSDYGFLQNTHAENSFAGSSTYWQTDVEYASPVYLTPKPFFQNWLQLLLQSKAPVLLLMLSNILILTGLNHPADFQWFKIQGSYASACLVSLGGVLAGYIIYFFTTLSVLFHTAPKPILCMINYKHGIPLVYMDGRRLRALSERDLLKHLAVPILVMMSIASGFIILSTLTSPFLSEVLLHLAAALIASMLLLSCPWASTLFLRDLLLRFRTDSKSALFKLGVSRWISHAFNRKSNFLAHENLLFLWCLWCFVYLEILLALISLLLRINYQALAHSIFHEDHLLLIFVMGSFLALAASSLLVLLFMRIICSIKGISEISLIAFWTKRKPLLCTTGFLFVLLFLVSCILMRGWERYSNEIKITLGTVLLLSSIMNRLSFGRGVESLLYHLPAWMGTALLLQGIHQQWFLPVPTLEDIYQLQPVTRHNQIEWLPILSMTCLFTGLVGLILYYTSLFVYRYRLPSFKEIHNWRLITILASGWFVLYWLNTLPLAKNLYGQIGLYLICLIIMMMIGCLVLFPSLPNLSITLSSLSVVLVFMGMLWNGSYFYLTGNAVLLIGFFAFFSAWILRKALDTRIRWGHFDFRAAKTDTHNLCAVFHTAVSQIYAAQPNLRIPENPDPKETRQYLHQLSRHISHSTFHALVEGLPRKLSWQDVQRYSLLLPFPVSFVPLIGWSERKMDYLLREIPLLSALSDHDRHLIIAKIKLIAFRKNDPIHTFFGSDEYYVYLMQGECSITEYAESDTLYTYIQKAGEWIIWNRRGRSDPAPQINALQQGILFYIRKQDLLKYNFAVQLASEIDKLSEYWQKIQQQSLVLSRLTPLQGSRMLWHSQRVHYAERTRLSLNSGDDAVVLLSGKASIMKPNQSTCLHGGQYVIPDPKAHDDRNVLGLEIQQNTEILQVRRKVVEKILVENL